MSLDGNSFLTAGGEKLHKSLGKRINPNGGYFYRWGNQKVGTLENGAHFGGFSLSHGFIEKISEQSRSDNKVPNEGDIGRECYSFSERENRAFAITIQEAKNIANKVGGELKIETDAIGNLYIKVQGESDETHMMGSHLDSVANGGKYDGVAGIAAGLETLQQVMYHKKKGTLKKSFCLTVFRSEESGPHNGMACLGSSIATGTISREKLEQVVYKTENGRDILLKEHFESSLRKYFQAVGRNERGDKGEMLWGEGEDYIDHEWWYFFCEEHGITEDDYVDGTWWEKITDSLKNPRITKENTASYQELHIEQGTIIENAKVDGKQAQLGIVSGGIGGAQRYKTVESIPVESENLSSGDYEVYSFEVLGFSDHTGSTPNNLELESSEYRRDAQLATNLFLREFLEKDFGNLISSNAQNDEGYTKVPYHQRIQLAIQKNKKPQFIQFVRNQRKLLREENSIDFSKAIYSKPRENIACISRNSAISMISSLLGVSEVAGNEFQRQREENPEEKQFGTTRATLTNVHLTPEGLDFHLDMREVDSSDVELLRDGISQEIQNIIPKGIDDLQKVSEKQHQKISTELRDKAKQIAEILGYTVIYLPSIPGHDADRLAAIGVPIGMIFVKQKEGISHNPLEKMTEEDYNVACHTIMKAVLANLV